MEEFQEADVMWPQTEDELTDCFSARSGDEADSAKPTEPSVAPIHIISRRRDGGYADDVGVEFGEDGLPPHILVERRSPVYSVDGRVLKGRHLSQVRNSILRMTGFLET